VFEIFAFLDLEQISEDFEIEHFETASFFVVFICLDKRQAKKFPKNII